MLDSAGSDGSMICPESGMRYQVVSESTDHEQRTTHQKLRCLDLDEEAPLPDALKTDRTPYDELKQTLEPRAA